MSTFSQSQLTGYHSERSRGFSLVELLISISIIGIITSVVLVKFTDFDSTTILKGVAYEVAATVREAQVLSISVLGVEGQFRATYGIHFVKGSSDYILFRDSNPATPINPFYQDGKPLVSAINTYTMMRGIIVDEICVTTNSGDDCSVGTLNVSFRRPEFASLYYLTNESGGVMNFPIINNVTIKLKSDRGDNRWNVTIGALGHISVVKD